MKAEKDKLEKKIEEMEKVLSQEKEKALLATLKSQQDEVLSSKVEASLKDIQDKLRRDKHEQEVQEERLSLKAKIKELETRLVQERETWMQTLKGQIQEREVQSKDVEGHFVYRLQEMERRWLEEKAQWQRTLMQKEDEVRSLKYNGEKLREVEDEFRRASIEKEMLNKELSRLKDDLARIEREKAVERSAVESYIRNIPEKEREIADLRAENATLRAREEKSALEFKHQEERFLMEIDKLQREIGRLQAEIGNMSDKKNAEKEAALKEAAARHELELQDKQKTIADVSAAKARAISELVKIKGFVSKVQAINAALEKERSSMREEKMQMAQAMASNIEDAKKYKQAAELLKAAHKVETESLMKKFQAEMQKIKSDCSVDAVSGYGQKIEQLRKQHSEDIAKIQLVAKSEMEAKLIEMRNKYESAYGEAREVTKKEIEQEFYSEMERLKGFKARAEEDRTSLEREILELKARYASEKEALEQEIRRLSSASSESEEAIAMAQNQLKAAAASMEEKYGQLESRFNSLLSAKTEYERKLSAAEAEKSGILNAAARSTAERESFRSQLEALMNEKAVREADYARLKQDLQSESSNRARQESETAFLKQKIQQLETQMGETLQQLEQTREAAYIQSQSDNSRISELAAEIEKYKTIEKSFADRMKWAFKGPQK